MTKNNNIMNTFNKSVWVDPIVTKKVFELIDNGSEVDRKNLKKNISEILSQINDKVNDPMYIIRNIYKIVKKYSIIIGRPILKFSGIEMFHQMDRGLKIAILCNLILEVYLKLKPNIL